MKLLVFGSDKPATRAVVDWLFDHGDIGSLVILTKTGLARYAWDRAGDLAKDRKKFWLERFVHGANAMEIAIEQMMAVAAPDCALCISPRVTDERIVRMLQAAGCRVVYGKLDAGKNVSWVAA